VAGVEASADHGEHRRISEAEYRAFLLVSILLRFDPKAWIDFALTGTAVHGLTPQHAMLLYVRFGLYQHTKSRGTPTETTSAPTGELQGEPNATRLYTLRRTEPSPPHGYRDTRRAFRDNYAASLSVQNATLFRVH